MSAAGSQSVTWEQEAGDCRGQLAWYLYGIC